ncbi:hypothetical protein [Hyalangium rubrum]|uniref:Uncharacterized protein n=1 Tax=Hyalangium rubrum TaxID=3103134 RepID=A0ABU5H6K4_9BACT|nr:hypothetical protein [Hyalangium sp. s54d21]MDY7229103.1 hypothetical protein [Hyalangium sp. s54d21]
MENPENIRGWGADADPANRPGIPMEMTPHPLPGSQSPIEPQVAEVPVVHKHGGRKQMPPVFGTAAPPKALSGVLRTVAYRYPDHWVRHWMMLLMADRVDSWEHQLRRALPFGLAAAAVLVTGGVIFKRIRR